MKSTVIALITASVIGLTACGGKKSGNQNTHTHEDGSIHEDHATEQTTPVQEVFKADTVSISLNPDSVKNDHDHEHDHSDPDHKH